MTQPERKQEVNPLRHRCYMTNGRVGFISFLDLSDIAVVGGAFYLSLALGDKLFASPLPKFGLMILVTVLAYAINFRVKKLLMPYPNVIEHFLNWWFSGIDYYAPDVDRQPVPLVVTRELRMSHAAEHTARKLRSRRAGRTRRVQKT
ncbi:hypothetical protein [Deinococcus enclensis]|uniref:TcpE family protein n=1 Tax=Deinococcus enclensis TaxID=1049582 RepID=A0ABT9MIV0_9DEIO|nr:hypothetical protein [Deinococcus enclensis]MDP9766124.1 hypothetical protein [Deinococcus enclensis]